MLKNFLLISTIIFSSLHNTGSCQSRAIKGNEGVFERAFFIKSMTNIADPVLLALSRNELKIKMPVEAKAGVTDRKKYTYLEAFSRTMAGIAPWLELGPDQTSEGQVRSRYIKLARICIKNATDPKSPDFMNFSDGAQPLVDAAFLAQALIRAPKQLWYPLDSLTKINVLNAFHRTRVIKPANNNWLLFTAMIETAFLKYGNNPDTAKISYAINKHMLWYKGDGIYGDGMTLHVDYYNSFVIQPMLLEILEVMNDHGYHLETLHKNVEQRAIRYAAIQERLISPEGTYPQIGRSSTYRFGAFQLLSQISLMHLLDKELKPQQVRAALYKVVKNQLYAPDTFDKNGWLKIGFYGHQPSLGEPYISTGSLYLCSQVFLILGLPANDNFWQGADEDWTAKKIWQGKDLPADHSID